MFIYNLSIYIIFMITTDAQRRAMQKWRENNKDHTRDYDKDRYEKRKGYLVKKNHERDIRLYIKIDELLGRKCFICNREVLRIHRHEINGEKHSSDPLYILEHINDFCPLCSTCHQTVHRCMKYLHLTWIELTIRLK